MLPLMLVACLAISALAVDRDLDDQWAGFKRKFGKSYTNNEAELAHRLAWENNLRLIKKHNHEAENGMHSYRMGVNQFADYFVDTRQVTSLKGRTKTPRNAFKRNAVPLPDSVDWRTKGFVTPVKNQGELGSAWAFAATGTIEGQYFNKTGKLVSFSEQQLVDCSRNPAPPQRNTCGWIDEAFESVIRIGGIMTEADYHCTQRPLSTSRRCCFEKDKAVAKLTGYIDVAANEDALQEAVATVGPVAVFVDGSKLIFYTGGIFDDQTCQRNSFDHTLLVVGYGHDDGKAFWIAKNSWGVSWGEEGYVRIARNANNLCGIASCASYPLIA